MAPVEWLLQVLSLVCCVIPIARLMQRRLFRVYPFFFAYLFIPLLLQTIVVRYGIGSREFCSSFGYLEPVRNIGYILLVWEIVSPVFRKSAGVGYSGRAIGLTALAPCGLILAFIAPESNLFHGTTLTILKLERGITFSLAILLSGTLCFAKDHLRLPHQSTMFGILCCIWFLGNSAILLAASLLPAGSSGLVNGALALLEIGTYIGWAMLLSKAGDNRGNWSHNEFLEAPGAAS